MINVQANEEKIADFCRRWNVSNLSLFGSALRDDFREDSDIDLLVAFSEDADPSLFDLARMQRELQDIFGRKVDLVSRRGLESSRNYLRRDAILDAAETVYGT
ncbi:MAG: nucleotidyltransferase family protein [Candidatus Sumerlaeota bacterium]